MTLAGTIESESNYVMDLKILKLIIRLRSLAK
ncbi:MAG: hypothetical protein R3A12_13870 [Ignavibacteria bacterium]